MLSPFKNMEIKRRYIMINDDLIVRVRNLTDQTVAYTIPELRVRRVFRGFEHKELTAGELRQLWYLPGGSRLLQDYLAVENQELAAEFGISEDVFTHEYSWTLDDVKRVLLTGSIDELADALDFAPIGIVDTIISQAVILQIPDINKHRLIQQVTGHDVTKMIKYAEELNNLVEDTPTERKTRRVGSNKEVKPQGRRVQ